MDPQRVKPAPGSDSDHSEGGVVHQLPVAKSDAGLVAALRANQPDAADELFKRYGPYVERLVVRVVGLDQDVPDVINEVFARALSNLHQLREPGALKGWLASVTIFTARVFLRNRSVRRHWLRLAPPDRLPDVPAQRSATEAGDLLQRTQAVLNQLPVAERIALSLRFLEGMDLAEVSDAMGVSLSTVKRRLARGSERFVKRARRDPVLREQLPNSSRWGEA